MKEHAACAADPQSGPSSSATPSADTQSHKTSEIWTRVYSAAARTQARIVPFNDQRDRTEMRDDVKVDIRLVRKHVIEAEEVPAGGAGRVKPRARLVRGEPSRERRFNPRSV